MATLAANDRRSPVQIATGGQTVFEADFPVIDRAGIFVERTRGGVVTTLSGADFKISNATEAGFRVTLQGQVAQPGDAYVIYSRLPTNRPIAHAPGGAIRTVTLEDDARRLQAQIQELRRDLDALPSTGGDGSGFDAEFVRDTMAAALVAGGGVVITPLDDANAIVVATDLAWVKGAIADTILPGANVVFDYDAEAGTITINALGGGGGADPEVVRDTIADALVAGDGMSITPNDAADTIGLAVDPEFIRDTIAAFLVAGSNVNLDHNDAADTLTISASGSGGGGTDPEVVRDTIAAALVAGSGMSITPNDAADTIGLAVDPEFIRDTIAAFLVAGSNVSLSHNDAANTLTISAAGGGGGGLTPPAALAMTNKQDYKFGSVSGTLASVLAPNAYAWFGVELGSAAGVSGENFALAGLIRVNGGGHTQQSVGVYGGAVCNTASGGGLVDAVGVLGQGHNESSSGRVWGGCFEAMIPAGTLGSAKGIEVNVGNANASNNQSTLGDSNRITQNIVVGSLADQPVTAAFWMNQHGAGGWYHGLYLRDIRLNYVVMSGPKQAGAVGLYYEDHANWGPAAILPATSAYQHWDGAGGLRNVLSWTPGIVKIGNAWEHLMVDLPPAVGGPGERQVHAGPPDSAGAGYRYLRIPN